MQKNIIKPQGILQVLSSLLACAFGILILLVGAAPCHANWVLDRYEYVQYQEWKRTLVDGTNQTVYVGSTPGSPVPPAVEKGIWPVATRPTYVIGSPGEISVKRATSPTLVTSFQCSVTPVYKWQGAGPSTPEFFTREMAGVGRVAIYGETDVVFTSQNRYQGGASVLENVQQAFDDTEFDIYYGDPATHGSSAWGTRYENPKVEWHITKWGVPKGAIEFRGQTRSMSATVRIPPITASGQKEYWVAGGAQASYIAEVCNFGIGVNLGGSLIKEFGTPINPEDPNSGSFILPHNRRLAAYAEKNWTNGWAAFPMPGATPEEIEAAMAKPHKFFWDGWAQYSADLSTNLASNLAPKPDWKQFDWKLGGVNDLVVTAPPPTEGNEASFQARERQIISTDTSTKDLHHNVQEYPVKDVDTAPYSSKNGTWPKTTNTSFDAQFNGTLKWHSENAQATIDWYQRPGTEYRSETTFEVLDFDAGTVTSLGQELGPIDEEAQLDEYMAEIKATKEATFETGKALVEAALQAEMVVGSWFVPDEVDLVTLVGGKVFKSIQALKVAAKAADLVGKFANKAYSVIKVRRGATGQRIMLRIRTKVYKVTHYGNMGAKSRRANQSTEELTAKRIGYCGGPHCFVAGTPVFLADGSTKLIEKIAVNDLVLSKDEKTGEIAAKRVVRLFERQAPSTSWLTFSNQERIETTAEHPFYVEHKGFMPAGMLAIGNSIVTRAGPAVNVTKVERSPQPKTVYNFEVEDYHTYFVGNTGFWVHNACFSVPVGLFQVGKYREFETASDVGDMVAGHEIIPFAWLSRNHPSKTPSRASGEFGGENTVIALPDHIHAAVERIKGRWQPNLRNTNQIENLSPQELVDHNIEVLREYNRVWPNDKIPDSAINAAHAEASAMAQLIMNTP